ncbi:HLH [Musa troglodytarum]|uniref:HLH n=1 Tax=Musa troglodytarum TaxID=320322 RepID=A0A9E7EWJ4_9LILI|nr:HLH [Musa troglodytarum]
MGSNTNAGGGWIINYGGFMKDVHASDFIWAPLVVDDPSASSAMLGFDALRKEDNRPNNVLVSSPVLYQGQKLAGRKCEGIDLTVGCYILRFTELCSIMDPGKPPKTDKSAILGDATRLLNHLRNEAKKIKESNEALQDAIKNTKAEKVELRDERTRLKAEKARMEEMLKVISTTPQFITQPAAATFHETSAAAHSKTIPYPNYLPMGMWQWTAPAAIDTSQDHVLRPPVA